LSGSARICFCRKISETARSLPFVIDGVRRFRKSEFRRFISCIYIALLQAKKALTDANGKRKAASDRLGASATSAKLSERLGASTRFGASEDRLGVSDRLGHVRPVRGPTVRAKKLNLGGVAARLEMFNQS